jgi:hypothetical protein
MPYYRLYFLDAGGHIERVHEAELASDQAAIEEAYRLDHAALISVWQQARHVADVDPEGGVTLPHDMAEPSRRSGAA